MDQVRLARQSNRVVRRCPRAQRAMGRLHARLYQLSGGRFRTPAWWLNLREAGAGEVIVGRRRLRVQPRLLTGSERDRVWWAFVAMYTQAEYYTRFTDRELPLIALEPAGA